MARQDIQADARYGEVDTTDNLTNKVIYPVELLDYVEGADNDNYCYAEITVPSDFYNRYTENSGIHVNIPYTALYKELYIRFVTYLPNGSTEYLINPSDNSQWFKVFLLNENEEVSAIRLSEFQLLNDKGDFNFIFYNSGLAIYSGHETDFYINTALEQNEIFLLKSFASNMYQYPTTGVGLIDFLHGNFEDAGLASKLQEEFENDKMIVKNAYMDSVTGELFLEVTEKDG